MTCDLVHAMRFSFLAMFSGFHMLGTCALHRSTYCSVILTVAWAVWFLAARVSTVICHPFVAAQVMNLLTPAIVALCGNSSVHSGAVSQYMSTREGLGVEIDPFFTRHGMADGPFYSILDYISYLARMPMLLRPRTVKEMVSAVKCSARLDLPLQSFIAVAASVFYLPRYLFYHVSETDHLF
jgi:hypothetical protein